MLDQEQGYVHYLYERYKGRIPIGVGYDMDLTEIFPFVYECPKGNSLGIVALSAVQQDKGPSVYIFHFSTFNPRHGSGRMMIEELCRIADHYQVVLSLSPFSLPNGNADLMNSKKLKSWYVSFGFSGETRFSRQPIQPLSPLSA